MDKTIRRITWLFFTSVLLCSQIFNYDFLSIFRVEEYVRKQLEGTDVKIEVIKGHETLKKEYPCFAAVDRCANQLENQRGCVIWLTYEPKGK